jgi:shikimate kinase
MQCKKILLCGFSGSGKTSLLKELQLSAPDSKWIFSDLDQMILKKKNYHEVSELVATHGWDKFRQWERQELEEWLTFEGNGVLALGGGALTLSLLNAHRQGKKICFCYLESTFADCWKRLHSSSTELRPLIKLGEAEFYRIYLEREKIFSLITWKMTNYENCDLKILAQNFWLKLQRS